MAELLVIAPMELAAGFRLAGVAVLQARSAAEAAEQVQEARSHDDATLVLVPEHLLAGFGPQEYERLLACERPWFVPVPMDWQSGRDDRRDLESRLGRILGCRINLPAQPAGGGGPPAQP